MDRTYSFVDEFFSGSAGVFERGRATTGKDLYLEVILSPRSLHGWAFPDHRPCAGILSSMPAKGSMGGVLLPYVLRRGVVRAEREFSRVFLLA